MNFKRIRYNLIVIGLIALVCCYIGTSFFLNQNQNINVNQGNTLEQDPIFKPDDNEEENFEDDESIVDADIPTDAFKLVEYALDILNNGTGYTSTFESVISNTAAGVSATQNLVGSVSKGINSKGEKVAVEQNYYYSNETGMASGMVANYFLGFYTNLDSNLTQVVTTNDYNYSAKTYDVASATRNEILDTETVREERKILLTDGLPFKISKSSANLVEDTSDKNYRYLTFKISKLDSLSKNFIDFYTTTGQISNVKYSEIKIIFKINKNTGYLNMLKREELFSATATGIPVLGNVSVNSSVVTYQTFKGMNTEVILSDSL